MQQFKTKTNQKKNTVQAKANRTGLPNALKSGVERLSGYSMDNVRVHYNSDKPAQVQALAYTQGTDIHVAPGQEKHLPHETWHVVQQMQGRVAPTMQHKNIQINDSPVLEREADIMGAKAAQQGSADVPVQLKQAEGSSCVQRRNDLSCKATVSYEDGKTFEAEAKNNGRTAKRTINVFASHGLKRLRDVHAVTNPPGCCAEPHSVAKALVQEGTERKKIKKIHVSPAVFTPSCKKWVAEEVQNSDILSKKVTNFGKAMIGHEPQAKSEEDAEMILKSSPNAFYPPCRTCKQWLNNNGNVKQKYIVR